MAVYFLFFDGTDPSDRYSNKDYITIHEAGEIRELDPKEEVVPKTMSKGELRTYLDDYMTDEMTEELMREERIYRNLFLIDDDFDLLGTSMDASVDEIAGFYDPDVKDMYVIGNHGSSYVNYVLSHEYTHALQDQHFNLTVFLDNLTYDENLARLALVEGDATLVMSLYLQTLSRDEQFSILADALLSTSMSMGGYVDEEQNNKAITSLTIFPYIEGLNFVMDLYMGSGWSGVNDAFENPPTSSEQILHPKKYRSGEGPVEIDFELPMDDFELEFSDTMGEAFIAQMIDVHIGTPGEGSTASMMGIDTTGEEAKRAAAGWGGDKYMHFAVGEEFITVFCTTWDTVRDNEEFNSAYDEVLEMLSFGVEDSIYSVRDGYVYKDSSGLDTTIFYSSSMSVINEVIEWQKDSP